MEYYPAINRNAIRPFVATWMDLESAILSEVSQTEKLRNRAITTGKLQNFYDRPCNMDTKALDTLMLPAQKQFFTPFSFVNS